AVPGSRDPRRAVNVDADVVALAQLGLACVQSHPDADRTARERLLTGTSSRERVTCAAEGHEERVALRTERDAAVTAERLPQNTPMLRQDVRVRVAELVQHARRALDVREQEGDGAGRELAHALMMATATPRGLVR